jgi:hypothetical protein
VERIRSRTPHEIEGMLKEAFVGEKGRRRRERIERTESRGSCHFKGLSD